MSETEAPSYPSADTYEEKAAGMTNGAAVTAASPGLTGASRRKLRGLGHSLKAVVMIGQQGLTDGLARALDTQLGVHELIKIKVLDGAPCSLAQTALWIHAALGAEVPQILGRTLLAYRPDPDDPKISVPRG